MYEREEFRRYDGESWQERAAKARMAWTGFQPRHGRTGTPRARGQGKRR